MSNGELVQKLWEQRQASLPKPVEPWPRTKPGTCPGCGQKKTSRQKLCKRCSDQAFMKSLSET